MDVNHFELWARAVGEEPARFAADDIVFNEGDSGRHMYIVRSGSVDIVKNGKVVETVGPNGIFGEMALIDGGTRSASAWARGTTELAPIDQRTFLLMVDEAPFFALSVMRLMAMRLRRNEG